MSDQSTEDWLALGFFLGSAGNRELAACGHRLSLESAAMRNEVDRLKSELVRAEELGMQCSENEEQARAQVAQLRGALAIASRAAPVQSALNDMLKHQEVTITFTAEDLNQIRAALAATEPK